ncbi:MAG: hypothetical protein ACE5JJ_04150 [Nitrospinota bacterium]
MRRRDGFRYGSRRAASAASFTALFRESGMEFEDEWRIVRPKG